MFRTSSMVAGSVAVVAVCAPTVAWACSCVATQECSSEVVVGELLPANADRVVWLTSWAVESQEQAEGVLVFEKSSGDEPFEEVPFVWTQDPTTLEDTIAPVGGFEETARYRVGMREEALAEACGLPDPKDDFVGPQAVDFAVISPVDELPMFTEVGEVERAPMQFIEGASCAQTLDAASVNVRVFESDVAESLGAGVAYSLWVDGAPYTYTKSACQEPTEFGALGESRFEAQVAAACGGASNASVLEAGVHTIEVRAELLGTGVVASETFTVDLSCDDPPLGSGCAQGGGRAPAPLGWFGLSVALGWFVRRRRLG